LKVVTAKFDFSSYINALENLFRTVIAERQKPEAVSAEAVCA
jgi:hypothetical protein